MFHVYCGTCIFLRTSIKNPRNQFYHYLFSYYYNYLTLETTISIPVYHLLIGTKRVV